MSWQTQGALIFLIPVVVVIAAWAAILGLLAKTIYDDWFRPGGRGVVWRAKQKALREQEAKDRADARQSDSDPKETSSGN